MSEETKEKEDNAHIEEEENSSDSFDPSPVEAVAWFPPKKNFIVGEVEISAE